MAREQSIVDSILRWLRELPCCESRKLHASIYTKKGDPDIYGCINGHMFQVEVKQPGQEPTIAQAARLKDWAAAGAITGCAHSLDEFKQIVAPLLTDH